MNFFFVLLETEIPTIEEAFRNFTGRNDVGIVLINQHVSLTQTRSSLLFLQRIYFTILDC
jgi:vacuolar-type H+-ATPase subunit F/Vma7